METKRQPRRQDFVLNVMAIRNRLHANMSIQTTSLAGSDVAPPMGVAYDYVTFQCFHREMKNTKDDTFIYGEYSENVNITGWSTPDADLSKLDMESF